MSKFSSVIIGLLMAVYLIIESDTTANWRRAYELKQSQVVYVSHGTLRHNPAEKHHIIVGYDVENCVIEAPDGENLIKDVNITVAGRQAYGISIGETKPKGQGGVWKMEHNAFAKESK